MEAASARPRKRPRDGDGDGTPAAAAAVDAANPSAAAAVDAANPSAAAAGVPQYTYYRPITEAVKGRLGAQVNLFADVAEIGHSVKSEGSGLKDLSMKNLELRLRTLKSDSTFDLVCKVSSDSITLKLKTCFGTGNAPKVLSAFLWVLHVCEHSGKTIFYVWDGTDTPAAEFQAMEDRSLDAEARAVPPLPKEVLCKMPCVGSVLRIFSDIPVKHEKQEQMTEDICWARFFKITCEQEFGIWKGVCSQSSGVRLLSHEDGSVVDCLKLYDSRNANKVLRRPMAISPSNVAVLSDGYKKQGYSTLMDSSTYPKVMHKVKTLVRVVSFYPCEAGQLGLLLRSTRDYSIRLTLEDPTARIHAYVHKDNLVEFFGVIEPLTEEVVIKKMNKLLGGREEIAPLTYNPLWIWCVLISYYWDENNQWYSRRFRIIHTRIRD